MAQWLVYNSFLIRLCCQSSGSINNLSWSDILLAICACRLSILSAFTWFIRLKVFVLFVPPIRWVLLLIRLCFILLWIFNQALLTLRVTELKWPSAEIQVNLFYWRRIFISWSSTTEGLMVGEYSSRFFTSERVVIQLQYQRAFAWILGLVTQDHWLIGLRGLGRRPLIGGTRRSRRIKSPCASLRKGLVYIWVRHLLLHVLNLLLELMQIDYMCR